MKRTLTLLFCLIFLSFSYLSQAQNDDDEDQLESLEYLKNVYKKDPKTPNISFFLGKAYLVHNDYDLALEQFNIYLTQKISAKQKVLTERLIENCNNAKTLSANPIDCKIENLGPVVNSKYREYVPVISADESVLIFTYKGSKSMGGRQDEYNNPDPKGFFYEDIMISNKVNGAWTEPASIGSNINGIGHDACIALSGDGQKLFIFKSTPKDGGDIYISKLEGSKWSVPEKLMGEVNTEFYESSASLSADERTLYFSSSRPGGYGGTDIYTAKIKADGTWGRIENMGPDINTPYNEDDPFIHSSGTILIYSSEGFNSMGGTDVFVSVKNGDKWAKAENLGVPVNTSDNDRFYVLSADAKRGYYSTLKPGGLGDVDIYTVEPGLPGKTTAMVLLSGTVYVDDKPVGANIIVGYVDNDNVQGDYTANSTTGKYLTTLPGGKNYKLIYVVDGFDDQIQTIDATNTTSFEEKKLDIKLYTADKNKPAVVEQTTTPPVDVTEKARESARSLSKPITEYTYDEMIDQFGELKPEGVIFSVQVGAYREPQNFRGSAIKSLGQIKKENGSDGITRFSQGPFTTLKAAESHRKKVIGKGTYDAFVTAFYNGQRMSLKEIFAKTTGQ